MAQEVSSSPQSSRLLPLNRKALHLAYPVSQLLILPRLTSHLPFLPALNRLLLPRPPLQQVTVKLGAEGGSRFSLPSELFVGANQTFSCRCHCVCCGLVTCLDWLNRIVRLICFSSLIAGGLRRVRDFFIYFFQNQQWHWLLAAVTSWIQPSFFIPDFSLF